MNEQRKTDDLIGRKLYDAEVDPPDFIWRNIDRELSKSTPKKLLPLWLTISGMAASVVLAFGLGWHLKTQFEQLDQVGSANSVVKKEVVEKVVAEEPVVEVAAQQAKEPQKPLLKTREVASIITPTRRQVPVIQKNEEKPERTFAFSIKNIRFDGFEIGSIEEGELYQKEKNELSERDRMIIAQNLELEKIRDQKRFKPKVELGARMSSTGVMSGDDSYDALQFVDYVPSEVRNTAPVSDLEIKPGGGVSVNYKVGKRLRIESGLYYSKLSQNNNGVIFNNSFNPSSMNAYDGLSDSPKQVKAKKDWVVSSAWGQVEMKALPNIHTDRGPSLTNSTIDYSTPSSMTQQAQYIEVPMIVKYRMIDRKIGIDILGGINTNFLVGNSVFIYEEGNKSNQGKTQGLSGVNYSSTLGIGVNYQLFEKISLNVEPQLKYYLNSLTDTRVVRTQPVVLGLNAGISYHF